MVILQIPIVIVRWLLKIQPAAFVARRTALYVLELSLGILFFPELLSSALDLLRRPQGVLSARSRVYLGLPLDVLRFVPRDLE